MLFLGTGAAWAQSTPPPRSPPPRQEPPAQQRERDEQDGMNDSVRRVERQTGGEVLRAEPVQRDGREQYRLKVRTADGHVRVVQDDPDKPTERPRPERKDKSKPPQASRDSDEDPPQ
jgi:hypothetical protein